MILKSYLRWYQEFFFSELPNCSVKYILLIMLSECKMQKGITIVIYNSYYATMISDEMASCNVSNINLQFWTDCKSNETDYLSLQVHSYTLWWLFYRTSYKNGLTRWDVSVTTGFTVHKSHCLYYRVFHCRHNESIASSVDVQLLSLIIICRGCYISLFIKEHAYPVELIQYKEDCRWWHNMNV